jgi:hypothetical protein
MKEGFCIGEYVEVNERGKEYTYAKQGSQGRVVGFNTDENTGEKVVMVRFNKISEPWDGGEDKDINPIWPVYENSIEKIAKKQKSKLVSGRKQYQCDDCGTWDLAVNMKKPNGYYVCQSCLSNYKKCKGCGEWMLKKMVKQTRDGYYFCKPCHKEHFTLCYECNNEVLKTRAKKGIDDRLYCPSCFEKTFGTCHICGDVFFRNELRHQTRAGEHICRTCYEAQRTIKPYNYTPRKFQCNKNPWDNTLLLGVELEIQHKNYLEKAEQLKDFLGQEKLYNYYYFKDDGSLKDKEGRRNGFEIVSQPSSLQHIHKNLRFKYILDWLIKNKFVSYWGEKSGLHVHISRDFFTNEEIKKLRAFCSTNYERIYQFGKRGSQGNEYCGKENFNKDALKSKKFLGQPGRHCGVNVNTQKSTIEFRMFRGTLLYSRFLATLQFCDALSHFVKESGSTIMLDYRKSWGEFKLWIENKNRYEHLVKYLKRNAL